MSDIERIKSILAQQPLPVRLIAEADSGWPCLLVGDTEREHLFLSFDEDGRFDGFDLKTTRTPGGLETVAKPPPVLNPAFDMIDPTTEE